MKDGNRNNILSKDKNTLKALLLSLRSKLVLLLPDFFIFSLSSHPPSPHKLSTPSVRQTAESAVDGDEH